MFKCIGVFALVPAMALLTMSYFVLWVNQKSDNQGLIKFGKVLVIVLWISAGIILSAGMSILFCGKRCGSAHEGMKGWGKTGMRMDRGCCMMGKQMMDDNMSCGSKDMMPADQGKPSQQ